MVPGGKALIIFVFGYIFSISSETPSVPAILVDIKPIFLELLVEGCIGAMGMSSDID